MKIRDAISLFEMVEHAKKLYLNEKYIRVVKKGSKNMDSKSVVDRPTKKPINEVLEALHDVNEQNETDIMQFVEQYLHEPGHEITKCKPIDWKLRPSFIDELRSEDLKQFSVALNEIWNDLYKKADHDVLFNNGCVSSHLPMKHPFVVPGGRFIEMYYWDTYWTMEGLLVCGMHKSVRMMLENFVNFIDLYGFIPNGSRVYYLNRSQPPYFSLMVNAFYEYCLKSKDLTEEEKQDHLKFILDDARIYMIKEYEFWMKERSVRVNTNGFRYRLNVFKANTTQPRPESYHEDIETAQNCKDDTERAYVYRNKASAAESGYDFSSRWNSDPMNMETIQTSDLIPVDLNSVLYKSETIISKLSQVKGDLFNSRKFRKYSKLRKSAINTLLWSKKQNSWADYDIRKKCLNDDNFYISNLSPLSMGIKPPNSSFNDLITKHMHVFTKFEGGVPVSFVHSKEQWDFPNTWAPNTHELVFMLMKTGHRQTALKVAKKFFHSVYNGWKRTGCIFEKYSLLVSGERGHGGEYEVQTGFGWTNGTVLTIIDIFKDELME